MFQSLLSWISRFGEWGFAVLFCAEVGFNPCCLGLAVLAFLRTFSQKVV